MSKYKKPKFYFYFKVAYIINGGIDIGTSKIYSPLTKYIGQDNYIVYV